MSADQVRTVFTEYTVEQLLARSVKCARGRDFRKGSPHPRWVAVMDNFGLGSTFAHQLCRRFDLDPNEMVKR